MKRLLFALLILLGTLPMMAQNSKPAPASSLAKDASDERISQLASDITALTEANEALQKRVAQLSEEVRRLRDEQTTSATAVNSANSGVQSDLKHLADSIREVDKKREEDKAAISDEVKRAISRLETAITAAAAAPAPRTSTEPKKRVEEAPIADSGYTYVVKPGDNPGLIIKAYNETFKSQGKKAITFAQVKALNPKIKDWNGLKVGQKIIIPDPPKAQ